MQLGSPLTAILSAVIYNAVIIVALIPLALKGVKYKEKPASQILRHNLLVYGLGRIDRHLYFYQIDRYRAKLFPTMNKLKEGCRNEKDSRDSIAFLGV